MPRRETHNLIVDGHEVFFDVNLGYLYRHADMLPDLQHHLGIRPATESQDNRYDGSKAGVIFSPGTLCTQGCSYCSAQSLRDKGVGKTLSREVIEQALAIAVPQTRVAVGGSGEPLVYPDVLYCIHETLQKMKSQAYLAVSTNGSLLDRSWLESDVVQRFTLSLDGPRDVHNACRGNYDDAITAIQLLRQYDRPLVLVMVVTRYTGDVRRAVEHLLAFKPLVACVVPSFVPFSHDASVEPNLLPNYRGMGDLWYNIIARQDEQAIFTLRDRTVGHFIKWITTGWKKPYRCNVGLQDWVFDSAGKIYPCSSVMHYPELSLGSVYDLNEHSRKHAALRKYYNEQHYIDKLETCRECWARYVCGGPCMAQAYIRTGAANVPDLDMCGVIRGCIEIAMETVWRLRTLVPDSLDWFVNRYAKRPYANGE